METFAIPAANLGATVFVVLMFLYYLTKRDKAMENIAADGNVARKENAQANIKLAVALQRLTDVINLNSNANTKNTDANIENTDAVKDNTKSTKNGNGGGGVDISSS